MVRLSDLGERAVVRRLLAAFETAEDVGLGDDAAFLRWGDGYLLLATDVIHEATHVPQGATGEQVGWYAAAVNFSDVAAMGGLPVAFVAAFSLPRDLDVAYVDDLARGVRACADAYGAVVAGGDTKEGPALSVAGTALGRAGATTLLRRVGCHPGDVLAVTGTLGRGGWAAARLGTDAEPDPVETLLRVRPRVWEGEFLTEYGGVTACMDISDGLAASLDQLSEANELAFRVEYDRLPMDPLLEDASPEERGEALLYRGGDFELLVTVQADMWGDLAEAMDAIHRPLTAIGEVLPKGPNLVVADEGEQELAGRGYEHFVA